MLTDVKVKRDDLEPRGWTLTFLSRRGERTIFRAEKEVKYSTLAGSSQNMGAVFSTPEEKWKTESVKRPTISHKDLIHCRSNNLRKRSLGILINLSLSVMGIHRELDKCKQTIFPDWKKLFHVNV